MLTERQLGIVLAVVYEYIKTGEPAGSRTITKKYIKGLSPATIRNEMSDLEDMEYFYQPHPSSGRLPTAKAYRLYVDSIMQRARLRPPETAAWEKELNNNRKGIESLLSHVTQMLGRLTNCVGVAAVSTLDETEIQRIDFVPLGNTAILLLIVLKGGIVYHGQFSLPFEMTPSAIDDFARRINTIAAGRSWAVVRGVLQEYVRSGLEEMADTCNTAIKEMDNIMTSKNYRFFSSGAQQILNLPDFQEISRIQAVLSLLEEEKPLAGMVECCKLENSMKVSIGSNEMGDELKENSLIVIPARAYGQQTVIGLIGPLRMDYERSISVLEGVVAAMEDKNKNE